MTSAIDQATIPLLPTKDTALRLRHFDSDVYNLDESSALYAYVDALVGDAGVGTLKKQLLINRLNASLDTTHFDDLDSTFGNIFKIARFASETYSYNPETDLLTTAQWAEVHVKDAWYRARVKNFFTALGLGGTPDGLRVMVRAALGVDTEIYEMWRFQDNYAAIYGIQDIESIQNLILNPSFEYDSGASVFGWSPFISGTGSTLTVTSALTSAVFSGKNALAFNSGTSVTNPSFTGNKVSVTSGKTYNFSLYYYKPSASASLTSLTLNVLTQDASGVSVSTFASTNSVLVSEILTRVNFSFTVPAGQVYATPSVVIMGSVTGTPNTIYFDSIQVQSLNGTNIYFDGDMSGYRWMGQPGQSGSIKSSPIDALSRTRVPSRNEVIIYPHKASISTLEMIQTKSMLHRLAPVDSVITVANSGYAVNVPLPIFSVKADSTFFQVQQYVTGAPGTDLSINEEPNDSYRWVSSTEENLAPGAAFNQPQEYSQYYLYSGKSTSAIDTVSYSSQDIHGTIFQENPYQTITEAPNTWGPWITFDKADSPDNYPGGKLGHAPTVSPGRVSRAPYKAAYVFPYASQASYVSQMKTKILSVGGQVVNTMYRLPISGKISTQVTWTPDLAVEMVEPNRLSAVTSGWYNRSPY